MTNIEAQINQSGQIRDDVKLTQRIATIQVKSGDIWTIPQPINIFDGRTIF